MAYHIVYSVVFTINVHVFRTNTEIINNETRFVQIIISYIHTIFNRQMVFTSVIEVIISYTVAICVYARITYRSNP